MTFLRASIRPVVPVVGHNPTDLQPWLSGGLFPNHRGEAGPFYSNLELYERFHPTTNFGLAYVYDNFLWPHCDLTGKNMVHAAFSALAKEEDPPEANATNATVD